MRARCGFCRSPRIINVIYFHFRNAWHARFDLQTLPPLNLLHKHGGDRGGRSLSVCSSRSLSFLDVGGYLCGIFVIIASGLVCVSSRVFEANGVCVWHTFQATVSLAGLAARRPNRAGAHICTGSCTAKMFFSRVCEWCFALAQPGTNIIMFTRKHADDAETRNTNTHISRPLHSLAARVR